MLFSKQCLLHSRKQLQRYENFSIQNALFIILFSFGIYIPENPNILLKYIIISFNAKVHFFHIFVKYMQGLQHKFIFRNNKIFFLIICISKKT